MAVAPNSLYVLDMSKWVCDFQQCTRRRTNLSSTSAKISVGEREKVSYWVISKTIQAQRCHHEFIAQCRPVCHTITYLGEAIARIISGRPRYMTAALTYQQEEGALRQYGCTLSQLPLIPKKCGALRRLYRALPAVIARTEQCPDWESGFDTSRSCCTMRGEIPL